MIDSNFFDGLGKITFETGIESDTFQAIDYNTEDKIKKMHIIVCVISMIMILITMGIK